ncbi:MAG: hypothetical protein KDN19_03460 [Verrucomicrobiae bacterium]|nr:hypothetical protein [Verrucomicrobiae bacterium]
MANVFPPVKSTSCLILSLSLFSGIGISSDHPEKGDDMPRRPATESLDELRSRETFERQLAHTRRLIAWHHAKITETEDDGDRDDMEDALEVLEYAERLLESTGAGGLSDADVFSLNTRVDRMLDSVEYPIDKIEVDPWRMFQSIYLGQAFGHATPRMKPEDLSRPIGRRQAEKESAYLFDPKSDHFYTASELACMTPDSVARLDIHPDHPAWLTRDAIEKNRASRLADFRQKHLRGITAEAIRDGDLEPGEPYSFGDSQRVLFLDEVYLNASSPKCRAKDPFGIEWKLKWADETQVEPVASALYLLAGARQTDFNYIKGTGIDEMVLILNDPDPDKRKKDKDDERYPYSYENFNQAMLDFYAIDVGVFVLDRGTVTEENIDRILRHLPPGAKSKYRKEKLIGREWLTFKQTLLELRPKGYIRRVDGARMSDLAADHDRVARGSFLFDLWIANRDAKDNNNKSYFIKEDDRIVDYHEGHHDLGLSLGPLLQSGVLNAVPTGTDFARKGLLGRKWRFPIGLIFKPDAWLNATWSDMKWMADRIVPIREREVREAVATTKWPDFSQEALFYKLRARQYRIAEMYGITDQFDGAPPTSPSIGISLADTAEIDRVERAYELPEGSLKDELALRGWQPGYRENLVLDGEIASCQDSALIATLVAHRYPSGLSERYNRGRKGTPPDCSAR